MDRASPVLVGMLFVFIYVVYSFQKSGRGALCKLLSGGVPLTL